MNSVLKSEQLNKELFKLYKGQWANIEKILKANPQLSHPQLIYVPEKYTETEFRLMIVGQQPYEWHFNKDKGIREDLDLNPIEKIEKLLWWYKNFSLGERYSRSPFWQAAHKLNELLNPNFPRYSFLWSNLIKTDKRNWPPDPDIEKELRGLRLLQEEIRITQPNVVVFFTGPDYDDRIRQDFEGVESDWNQDLARLQHKSLPKNSFRTYHPGHLRRKRKWAVINRIADLVKKPD